MRGANQFPFADDAGAVYAGFSQGATMGALMIGLAPDRFPRAILMEGGGAEWSRSVARAYAAAGGTRVLFACGRARCSEPARASIRWLGAAGVTARLVADERAGHSLAGGLAEKVREAFAWVVEGDARWGAE